MSEDNDPESKTEEPSQKKLDDARKKGDVLKSQEVTTLFMMAGAAALIGGFGPSIAGSLSNTFRILIANADQYEVGSQALDQFWWNLAGSIIWVALVPFVIMMALAIVANFVQHAPLVSYESITPKLSKISPLSGFKRLFGMEALVNFLKGLIKLGLVGVIIFLTVWPERDRLETMMTADVAVTLQIFMELGMKLFWAAVLGIAVIAGADYFYQRHKWFGRQRMTLQEVKDEYKQMEGDPHIKGKLRQLRQERSRQRMMANVPNSTVVVTNPTHYAVALKYDKDMAAPICVAKGVDAVALRIRGLAEENDVPIVENPPLARALYASVDIDETIPTEHFKAVAQVIGFVMRLKDKKKWRPA